MVEAKRRLAVQAKVFYVDDVAQTLVALITAFFCILRLR